MASINVNKAEKAKNSSSRQTGLKKIPKFFSASTTKKSKTWKTIFSQAKSL